MKHRLALATALLLVAPLPRFLHAGEACCPATPAIPPKTSAPVGHPLRGVVVAVLADKQALLVKHEEIPGVMRAMTMLLKVDAPTLAAAQKDQTIVATLVKKPDGWWLENVRSPSTDSPSTPASAQP